MTSELTTAKPCKACQDREPLGFEFSMAFQPIINLHDQTLFAYEALVRGTDGAGAASILSQVNADNRYQFDQSCRVKAVELAARLNVPCHISINFLPNAVYQAATCIRATLEAAQRFNFPTNRLIFEITENEHLVDKQHLKNIIEEYRRQGFKTAIDDFGAGYSGLNLLAEFQPDIIKLDMALIRDIHKDRVRQAILIGILGFCRTLDIEVIAEGIETAEELAFLQDQGIQLFQGYLFARPGFEQLPAVIWPQSA
ncbi:EAL domain-containing protein [Halopseudomonas phragmitis]|uniref:Diguanylate phosphodiesterase n=2 Tax=Pseudomonadaceae TaxID=135621 RepID=A0A1V0B0A6_9GAMM|nr:MULTISPECIES: EAL domain-containing protein [Pseudomonadaceae]AQZ93369.1 diguanylate phosphodiesterase [Halopseudomonas phragmitis]RHW19859.1 EAL domain-containing protein [Pseudomonas jilinensis]